MSYADIVAETDLERLEKKLDFLYERQNRLVEKVNSLNENIRWVVENATGIFQMFNSPAFMARLPGMLSGMGVPGNDGAGSE